MLADLARRDGRSVAAFDLFGDLDLHRVGARVVALPGGSLTALVDAAVQEPAVASSTGPASRSRPALVARLAERHTLLGNPPQTLRAVGDPPGGSRRRCTTRASRTRPRSPPRRATARGAGCASRCAAAAAALLVRWRGLRPRAAWSRARRRGASKRSCSGSPGPLVGRRAFRRPRARPRPPRLAATALLSAPHDLLGERPCGDCSASTSCGMASAPGRRGATARRWRRSRPRACRSSPRTRGDARASFRRSRPRAVARPARPCSREPRTS